ncbi:hypothetical protein QBC47DRAFT_53380 [Echria macrotheca]|uniref:Uncharacterized protein n=1 Tax=Echria macrotheca TaxID=438768 RepID=A0AAJ0B8G8_9PEZI|nr:hypothetical protein QBC47DRAFT_53380 [Echria macrotheca]
MRTTFILAATALGSGLVDAASNMLTPYGGLNKRQAFDPDETTGTGANCVDAFGPGYIECVPATETKPRLCVNPGLGETCCDAKWGCPGGSFCLVQDLCCPNGLDPKTCAIQNSVELPPDFSAPATSPPSSVTAAPEAAPSSFISEESPSSFTSEGWGYGGGSGSDSGSGSSMYGGGGGGYPAPTGTVSAPPPFQTAGAGRERAGFMVAVLGVAVAFAL